MGKLPGYNSQQTMSTQPATQFRDMAQEQQMGKNIQFAGKVARDLASVWQEAEDFQQTLEKQNNLDDGTRKIIKQMEEDPEYRRSDKANDDLDALRLESLDGFSNNQARNKFAVTANNQIGAAKIKTDSIKRSGLLKDTEASINKSFEFHKNGYIADGDSGHIDTMNGLIAAAVTNGTYDPVKGVQKESDMLDWEQYRYLQIAMGDPEKGIDGDPQRALDLIDASSMQPSEKNAAKAAILATARQGAIVQEIEAINRGNELYTEADSYLDDTSKSYVDKLDFIQQQVKKGLSATRADKLKRELYSSEKVNATTHTETMQRIIRMTDSLKSRIQDNKGKKNKKDIKKFLLEVKAVQDKITDARAAGAITQGDKKTLLKDLGDTTADQKAISAGVIKNEKRAFWVADYFVYGYDDAYKQFEDAFGDLPDIAGEALVELYTQSKANGYNVHQTKQATSLIIDTYKNRMRAETEIFIKQRSGAVYAPTEPMAEDDFLNSIKWTDTEIQAVIDDTGMTRDEVITAARKKMGK